MTASKVKGMRELKNLDCSISPVKCQRRRGFFGSQMFFPFPLRCSRGFGLLGLFVGYRWFQFWGFLLGFRVFFFFGFLVGYLCILFCVLRGALRFFDNTILLIKKIKYFTIAALPLQYH